MITSSLPSTFTHDHLTLLREVAYDHVLGTLISSPVAELVDLRNGTLASEKDVEIVVGAPHVIAGTGAPNDASTADVVLRIAVPRPGGATLVRRAPSRSGWRLGMPCTRHTP